MALKAERGILVFAKAPVAGAVKTRMQPRLSELQSLALHEQLLNSIIDNLLQVSLAPIELWLTQSTDRLPAWPEMDRYYQCEGDLGQRLYHALQSALQRYHKVIVVGADCPFIDGEYLLNAFEELDKDKRIVLGPACDGGYVMMALKDLDFRIFTGIDWGSDKVLAQT